MHHRNPDETSIWIDAEGRELLTRLSTGSPKTEQIDAAVCYARRARSRYFTRAVRRLFKVLLNG